MDLEIQTFRDGHGQARLPQKIQGGGGGWTKEHGYFGTRADTEICELSSDLTAGQNALIRLPRRPRRILGRGAEPVGDLVSEDLKLFN